MTASVREEDLGPVLFALAKVNSFAEISAALESRHQTDGGKLNAVSATERNRV